jgi:Leucine-rich repeat (LRR) protein
LKSPIALYGKSIKVELTIPRKIERKTKLINCRIFLIIQTMKKILLIQFTFLICLGTTFGQTPVMTMTTANAIGSDITIRLKRSGYDGTCIQIDFGDGNLVSDCGFNGAPIKGTIVGSLPIKIYGTGITYLKISNRLTSLDISGNPALTELDCSANQLMELDLSKNTELTTLDCDANLLSLLDLSNNTALIILECQWNNLISLDLTKNKALTLLNVTGNDLTSIDVTKNTELQELICTSNELTSLDISQNMALTELGLQENHLIALDISQNHSLKSLNCGGSQLTTLDITQNPELGNIECFSNKLSTLDVTRNRALWRLDCQNNQLANLDLSQNDSLIYLNCSGNRISFLDLTEKKRLKNLQCDNNHLTNLDVTWNKELELIYCENNLLTSLDISNNILLTRLYCSNNFLNFATLPLKLRGWIYYVYAPQYPLYIDKDSNIGDEIDLSNQYSIDGKITAYTWKKQDGTPLVQGMDYLIANGKTVFIKNQTDSVFCEMTNDNFIDFYDSYILKTTKTKISGKIPAIRMTTVKSVGTNISFSLKASAHDTPVQIDFGDGTLVNKNIDTLITMICYSLVGSQTVKIYGTGISYFDCSNNQLSELYINPNYPITYLDCSNNQLTDLDINPLFSFTYFACNNNQLTFFTLPLNQYNWTAYHYAPQKPVFIKKDFSAGDEVDLSNQLNINGATTIYNWKTQSGINLKQGIDYLITNGATLFIKDQTDSIYCEMTNISFPDFNGLNVLKTTHSKALGQTPVMTITFEINNYYCRYGICPPPEICFYLAADSDSTKIKVDFGDSIIIDKNIGINETEIRGSLSHKPYTVNIYGTGITSLRCNNSNVFNLDVSKNPALKKLDCSDNEINSLDLTRNKALIELNCHHSNLFNLDVSNNIALTKLDCSNNNIQNLDLERDTALTILYCTVNSFLELDITRNTKLTTLACSNNAIAKLDLSRNTTLTNLDCSRNQLSELNLTKNIVLTDLWCGFNRLTALDVSKSTTLTTLYCNENQLTGLDLTNNTALISLSCGSNQLTELDLSNNKALAILWCGSNKLTSLDLISQQALTQIWCGINQLTSLELTSNNTLIALDCSWNQLTALDLTGCTALTHLWCNNNQLSSLFVNEDSLKHGLNCNNNSLNFATLPHRQTQWNFYDYAPQFPIYINKIFRTGDTIDLCRQQEVNGDATIYTWISQNGTILLKDIDYVINNGSTLFIKSQSDSVYCEMTNASFPNFNGDNVLKTTNTKIISNEPVITLTTAKSVGDSVSLSFKADTSNTPLHFDYGDGTLTSTNIDTSVTSVKGSLVSSQSIKVYGAGFPYLNCSNNQLINLSLNPNNHLNYLDCSQNQLTFLTLPLKQAEWTTYYYAPQKPIFINKDLGEGFVVDLSKQLNINGETTLYNWKTQDGTSLTKGIDFVITDGVTSFIKSQTDSVYCEMTNAIFPDLSGNFVLKTTNTKVRLATATEDIENSEVKIYTDYKTLYINMPSDAQLFLFDINGRLVISKFIHSGKNSIQLESSGIYLIKLTGNKESVSQKILIQ